MDALNVSEPRQLDWLVKAAAQERVRTRLLSAGAAAHMCGLLLPLSVLWQLQSGSQPGQAAAQLLGLLRVLRNLCAAGGEAGAALVRCCVLQHVAALVAAVAARCASSAGLALRPGADPGAAPQLATVQPLAGSEVCCVTGAPRQLLTVVAQLLANVAASGADNARAVWRACHPETFRALAAVEDGEAQNPPECWKLRSGVQRHASPKPALEHKRARRQRAGAAVSRPAH